MNEACPVCGALPHSAKCGCSPLSKELGREIARLRAALEQIAAKGCRNGAHCSDMYAEGGPSCVHAIARQALNG